MTATVADVWCEEDFRAWSVLAPLTLQGGYLPWTTGSMRPAALVAVCNEIVHGARTRIVECGSGVSTVLLARLLRERRAGTITAVEHDRHWAELIQEQLGREMLNSIARVVYAPLQGQPPWYEPDALQDVPDKIDLLIVDGPPAFDSGHGARRAPALPHFARHLVDGATVILDDINRTGERTIITGWEASTEWRFVSHEGAGIAVGRPGPPDVVTTTVSRRSWVLGCSERPRPLSV